MILDWLKLNLIKWGKAWWSLTHNWNDNFQSTSLGSWGWSDVPAGRFFARSLFRNLSGERTKNFLVSCSNTASLRSTYVAFILIPSVTIEITINIISEKVNLKHYLIQHPLSMKVRAHFSGESLVWHPSNCSQSDTQWK